MPIFESESDLIDPASYDWRSMSDDELFSYVVENVPQALGEATRREHALTAAKAVPGRKFRRSGQ